MTDGSGTDQDLALIARLRRFRREHPAAEIMTKLVHLDETAVVVRAKIAIPDGGKATGYGSTAPATGGASVVEQAEWRAIGRALTVLGFNPMLVEETATAPATGPEQPPARVRPLTGRAHDAASPGDEAPASTPSPPSESASRRPNPSPAPPATVGRQTPPPVEIDPARERSGPSLRGERPAPVRAMPKPQPINPVNADPDLADYSFTAFWKWARELGYNSKGAIEELIGQSMTGLSPLELRRRVLAARGDDGRDD